jgi:hypothetical protein
MGYIVFPFATEIQEESQWNASQTPPIWAGAVRLSFMVSSAFQNPSLSYMAFTARAADYAVAQMKRGDL